MNYFIFLSLHLIYKSLLGNCSQCPSVNSTPLTLANFERFSSTTVVHLTLSLISSPCSSFHSYSAFFPSPHPLHFLVLLFCICFPLHLFSFSKHILTSSPLPTSYFSSPSSARLFAYRPVYLCSAGTGQKSAGCHATQPIETFLCHHEPREHSLQHVELLQSCELVGRIIERRGEEMRRCAVTSFILK